MGGKVNGRNLKLVKGPQKPSGGLPTPQEVFNVARSAVHEIVEQAVGVAMDDTSNVAKVLGEKIAMLYTEEVKTAIMVNSLVEILIEKGILTKEEFKGRVDKNSAETQQTYQRATEAMRTKMAGTAPEAKKDSKES